MGRTLTSAPVSTRKRTPVRRSVTNKRRPLEGGRPGGWVAISSWPWRFPNPQLRGLVVEKHRVACISGRWRHTFHGKNTALRVDGSARLIVHVTVIWSLGKIDCGDGHAACAAASENPQGQQPLLEERQRLQTPMRLEGPAQHLQFVQEVVGHSAA